MCRALPQGLQLAQVTLGFSGHRVSVLLLPWWRWLGFSPSLLFLCQGAPVAVVSAWVDGAVTLCFWPAVFQAFVGCEGGLGCPSWFVILFLGLLSFTFSGVGVAWSQVCGPSCDSWVLNSSDARLRRPDTLASGRTLSFCRRGFLTWAFVRTWVSRRLATLAVGWSRRLLFSWALPWVLPSRFQCWSLAWGGWGFSLVVLPP